MEKVEDRRPALLQLTVVAIKIHHRSMAKHNTVVWISLITQGVKPLREQFSESKCCLRF